jgi:UDP-N-acetylmuramate: L-alanyl-gamma-D-glutamyl-meso-diaminopimelate ligase
MTDPAAFKEWLLKQSLDHSTLLLMSSGTYGGLDFEELKKLI